MSRYRAAFSSGLQPVVVEAPTDLAPFVDAFFPDYRVDAPERHCDLVLRESPDGMFELSTGPGGSSGGPAQPLADALSDFEYSLAQLLADRLGRPLIHAGGVETLSGVLLLPGDSGSGKSSLTAAFAVAGTPVLGDDAVGLDAERPGVVPFKRLIKLHPGARTALDLGPGDPPLGDLWPEESFHHPDRLGSAWSSGGGVRHVVFPEWISGVRPQVDPERSGIGIRRLMELVLQGGGAPVQIFDALAGITARARYYRLRFGDCREAAAHLRDVLDLDAGSAQQTCHESPGAPG